MKLDEIREEFKGYHVEINLFPSGGSLEATGCQECGTDDKNWGAYFWKIERGESIKNAIKAVKKKIGDYESSI